MGSPFFRSDVNSGGWFELWRSVGDANWWIGELADWQIGKLPQAPSEERTSGANWQISKFDRNCIL